MKTAIIIPAHNEENYIRLCLEAYISQTIKPDLLLVVDDNSTDDTAEIVASYSRLHPWIRGVHFTSESVHQPGAKVVNAFNYGKSKLKDDFDLIGKFDADIILPPNYFETVGKAFEQDPKLGLCSGLLFIEKGQEWFYESIASRSHVRGPVKLYRKTCLNAMGGLRAGLGWDTADTFLLRLHGFEMKTLPELKIKHLRPTGASYSGATAIKQGVAYRSMRYGIIISLLAALKMAWLKRSAAVVGQSIKGYRKAAREKLSYLVTVEEGRFIRKRRWQMIRRRLF